MYTLTMPRALRFFAPEAVSWAEEQQLDVENEVLVEKTYTLPDGLEKSSNFAVWWSSVSCAPAAASFHPALLCLCDTVMPAAPVTMPRGLVRASFLILGPLVVCARGARHGGVPRRPRHHDPVLVAAHRAPAVHPPVHLRVLHCGVDQAT